VDINIKIKKINIMKKLSEITLCLILTWFTFGQNKAQNVPEKTRIVDVVAPVFTFNNSTNREIRENNIAVLYSYLHNNINYPESALDYCLQGTEVVQFTVMPTGNLANIKVVNSVCPEIDKEVIRVLNTTNGMWMPGSQNGTPCEVQKELLIVFHLGGIHSGSEDEFFMKKARNWYLRGNRALFEKQKPEKALKHYNNAMRYRPLEEALLLVRGMVKLQLNDTEGAKNDWSRVNELFSRGENENNLILMVENFKDFPGYSELLNNYISNQ
jgi:tetratricopeptide (TPR) repeat protein